MEKEPIEMSAMDKTTRRSVLDDVRGALGRRTTLSPAPLVAFVEPAAKIDLGKLIERFTEEATAVRTQVHYLSHKFLDGKEYATTAAGDQNLVEQIGALVSEICHAAGASEVAISNTESVMNLQAQLAAHGCSIFLPDKTSFDHEQIVAQLANCGVGLTAADYAIAETGTVVLSSDEPNALLVSLLPPLHIALVQSKQIIATMDEALSRIGNEQMGRTKPARSVTLITGPSRTSDVELVLSIGVHGPKELHVIILD
jgi:L-lactate dehydrogenase complex protein LldG